MPQESEGAIEIVDLTPENVQRLTDKHITRYERRLEAARNPNSKASYNVPELFKLLRLWSGVREKNHIWVELTCCERTEVMEAITSGE